jgi:hypothetical protein
MPRAKNPEQKQPAQAAPHTKQPALEPPEPPPHAKGFGQEFLVSIVAHLVAPVALAFASAAWLYFAQDPNVPRWRLLIFVVFTILFAYLSLISLQYFFHRDCMFPRRVNFHIALLALFVVTVTAPLALTLSFTTPRMVEMVKQVQKMEEERKREQEVQQAEKDRRIQLYYLVNDKMGHLLQKENLDDKDLSDLLLYCIRSIELNNPRAKELGLRATVVYLDRTGKALVMPPNGYHGFDSDIKDLRFDVSERDNETDEAYLKRIGVAGWSYINKTPVLDDDVQMRKEGEGHLYMPYPGSSKDRDDRAMICVGIPDVKSGEKNRLVGVLSISSATPAVFEPSDQAVARFFATLLGKFKTPI